MTHLSLSPRLTDHARCRIQQRGKRMNILEIVYMHADRERRAGPRHRAFSLSRYACRDLIDAGLPAAAIEKAARVELVLSDSDDFVITVLNNRH